MNNVAIVVEKEPPRPGLLGLYQGRPLANRSVFEGFTMPDKITIFQGPHERLSRTRAEVEQMVADTVWHEIAHHFGRDEARVRRAERQRGGERVGRATLSERPFNLNHRNLFRLVPVCVISSFQTSSRSGKPRR